MVFEKERFNMFGVFWFGFVDVLCGCFGGMRLGYFFGRVVSRIIFL